MTERPGSRWGHDEFADDLAAYALGALAEPDATKLERHLQDCATCQARLRWLRGAVEVLPGSGEQLIPPPALRERILSQVYDDLREPVGGDAVPERRWRSWRGLAWRPATALAAVALLLAGIAGGYFVRGSGESRSVIAVHPTAAASDAAATLERVDGSATLHVRRMPALSRGQVYEVWLRRGARLDPSSVFVLRRDRTGEAAVSGPLDDADGVLVTREPHGGSEQPTSPVLLRASLH